MGCRREDRKLNMKIKAKFHHVLGRNISRVKSQGFSEDRYFSEFYLSSNTFRPLKQNRKNTHIPYEQTLQLIVRKLTDIFHLRDAQEFSSEYRDSCISI